MTTAAASALPAPSAAAARDALAPRRPPGMRLGLALAIAAHVLLILAIAFGVAWKTSEPDGLVAELWAPTVQQAAPRATAPEPPTPTPTPTPTPRPEPPPQAAAPPPEPAPVVPRTRPPERAAPTGPSEAEIALQKQRERQQREAAEREKARREDQRREQQERVAEQKEQQQKERAEQQRRERAEAEKRRLAEAEKEKREQAERADREKREERQLASLREANLRRMQGQAGATGEPTATGTAARSAGPSAGYAGRIRARVKPNITLTGEVPGNPTAVVEVRAAPDGTIVGRRIVQSSGSAAWDEIVLRAIDKTEILPRDTDGSVPSPITIAFRPRE